MSILAVKKSAAAVAESGGGYLSKSGIYDVTIKFASVDTSKNGALSVNFNLDYNGNDQTIYGPYIQDNAGNPLEIGIGLVNKLSVIAGLEDGQEPTVEEETHAVGKDKTEKEFQVITDYTDLPIKIRLQEEYSINPNTNEIQKRMVVKSFFRADGASAEEIVNDTEIGKRLALEEERYSSNITFKDNLTQEDVDAFMEQKKAGAKPATATKAKPAAKANPFAKAK